MSTGQNKETFRRFNEGMNSGDWELISKTIDGRIAETWGVVDVL